jgi:hypothetical protein
MIYRIKRFDVLSIATTMGVLYAALGLVVGLFLSLFLLVGTTAAAAGGDKTAGIEALFSGGIGIAGSLIGLPLFYGTLGFIAGAVMALLYNLVAKFSGGIGMNLTAEQGE